MSTSEEGIIVPRESIEVFLKVAAEGRLALVGHDLALRFMDVEARIVDKKVEVVADARRLEVVGSFVKGQVDPSRPSAKDRKKIQKSIHETILESARYPEIRWCGELGQGRCEGTLYLKKSEGPLAMDVVRQGDTYEFEGTLLQSAFSIAPYSALMGQLRVSDQIVFHGQMRVV